MRWILKLMKCVVWTNFIDSVQNYFLNALKLPNVFIKPCIWFSALLAFLICQQIFIIDF